MKKHIFLKLFVGVLFIFGIGIHITQAQGWASTDFLISDFSGQRIAVYNQNLVFQSYLDTGFVGVTGLSFLSNGNLVATGRGGGRMKIYDPTGAVLVDVTDSRMGSTFDTKASPSGRIYVGTQGATNSVPEFDTNGTYIRTFGAKSFAGIAVFGNTLWAHANSQGGIDTFNIATGNPESFITFDNGQTNADTMYYSPLTSTVLMTDDGNRSAYERATDGTFIRQFTGASTLFGITRGPGGDVFTMDTNALNRWQADGTFVGNTSFAANVTFAVNIVWAGSQTTTAANVTIAGRVQTPKGIGIPHAFVSISDSSGVVRTTRVNQFGYFKFADIEAGETYILNANAKGYTFAPQVLSVDEDIKNLTITSQ